MNGLLRTLLAAGGFLSVLAGSTSRAVDVPDINILEGPVAVVNTDIVSFSQVREMVAAPEKQARATLHGDALLEKIRDIRVNAINDLVDRALILQESKSTGFVIPAARLDERVEEIVRGSFGGDRAAFLKELSAQGFTLEKFREYQCDAVVVQEMRKIAMKDAPPVSEERIQDYYREHAADYGPRPLAEVRPEIEKTLLNLDRQQKLREWIQQLRKKAFIKIY